MTVKPLTCSKASSYADSRKSRPAAAVPLARLQHLPERVAFGASHIDATERDGVLYPEPQA